MADDTLITGTTVGDISYVVAYYDVNTGNLYDANGNMYGNSTLTTTLDNEFILELHYVQDISTDSDPTTWAVWGGLEGKTVDSSLAFDSDYKHAYEGASTESTAAASHEIKVTVSSVDKDTLNSEGNLIINPYGLEPEQIPQGSTSTPRMVVPYDSFEYVSSTTSGTVFKFHVADPDGLMYAVPANIQVRVSDPLYLYINPSSIYEVNIPPRYNEGVFKFPMNIMSRKLLKALDYTGVSGVVGTLEHKISVRRDTLTGVSYNSNTYTRDKDKDSTAVYSGDTFLFCAWVNGSSTIWTKGNDVQTNTAVYSISNGTATLLGSTANPVTETDSVLFRTFAFPFLVKNLIDYNATIDIPMQDVDWAKDYIISIIKNNMEEVTGKASTGAYGVVKIANDGTIDVDDGVISIATSLATKQDNMSATAPVAINNSTVSLNFGDGLDVGVTGTTNANKLIVNEASVKEVLEDVVDGGTEPAVNEIVTADNLRGALSVGQAVDVSCKPYNNSGSIVYVNDDFLQGFTATMVNGTKVGFYDTTDHKFPKFANNLVYLFIADVSGSGTVTPNGTSAVTLSGTPQRIWTKVTASNSGYISASANATMIVTNWRQYEVTALTDEAIAYIAQLPDPDAFFRSTSAYSIRDKYLIKQDMVCPFIPTINMPDNSDLTVAAGLSYKIKYTNDNTHTITADTIPTDAYGWDTHIQMFIKGTSVINFQAPLVLMDALTPNAGHNMVVKWRNGDALVYVDDTNAGYIVVKASGTGDGTLNDAISNDYTDYAIFSGDLAGTVIDAGNATFAGGTGFSAVNILGNGTEDTVITGNISATSGKTINFQSLTIDGGTFGGDGTMNLDDATLSGNVDVLNLVVLSNVSIDSSATIHADSGSSNLRVNGNITLNGALYVKKGTMTIVNTNISITGNGSIHGGQLYVASNRVVYVTGISITDTVGSAWSEGPVYVGTGTLYLTDCELFGNTCGYGSVIYNAANCHLNNCCIHDNTAIYASVATVITQGAVLTITGSTISDPGGNQGTIILQGENWLSRFYNSSDSVDPAKIVIEGNAIINAIDDTKVLFTQRSYDVGNNVTLKSSAGAISVIDGFESIGVRYGVRLDMKPGSISKNGSGIRTISLKAKDIWSCSNFVMAGIILDCANVDTVSLSNVKLSDLSKLSNVSRIQLPASTTVSFQGNTNDADTKILDASLIVVGDNPTSPSGSATVVNASGTSSTVSGIGTYIDKEGDNDFVANNATNVVPVDASTTGAKYLGTVLSATTGDTGANRFAKIDSGAVAVVNEATNAVNKQIITHDYEPILGGTFSLTSATVNEATKTVAIQSGGTMSIVDVRGGKDSVIKQTSGNLITTSNVHASNVIFSGFSGGGNGPFALNGLNNCTFTDCTITGYTAYNGAIFGNYSASVSPVFSNCTFSGNSGHMTNGAGVGFLYSGTYNFIDCAFADNFESIFLSKDANITFGGTTKESSFVYANSTHVGSVTLTSGAILDLTGNTNATPIATGGGVVFSGANQIIYGESGATTTAYIDGCTAATIASGGVVQLSTVSGGTVTVPRNIKIASGNTFVASNFVLTGGSGTFSNKGTLTLANAVISGGVSLGASGNGGALYNGDNSHPVPASAYLTSCTVTDTEKAIINYRSSYIMLSECVVSGNTIYDIRTVGAEGSVICSGGTYGSIQHSAGTLTFAGVNSVTRVSGGNGAAVVISSGASINLTSSIDPGGTGGITVLTGGCTVNGNTIAAGTYTSIDSNGQPT